MVGLGEFSRGFSCVGLWIKFWYDKGVWLKGWELVSFYLVGPNKQREIKQERKRKKEMGLSVFVFLKRVLYSILD